MLVILLLAFLQLSHPSGPGATVRDGKRTHIASLAHRFAAHTGH